LAVAGQKEHPLRAAILGARFGYVVAFFLSLAINLLMLTGPLFMLQVYDRVLASRSVPTLLALLALISVLFAGMAILEFIRARILSRIAHGIDMKVAPDVFQYWLQKSAGGTTPGYRPLTDLGALRSFLSSPYLIALYDLPWFPIYLIVVAMLHVWLGYLAIAGAVIVAGLALLNEWMTSKNSGEAAQLEISENHFSDEASRNADSLLAMGMSRNAASAWLEQRYQALATAQSASERAEVFQASSKVFRLFLQSLILALGSYLVIQQEMSPGAIVAASILAGKALAPIDQVIGGWKQIRRARTARQRLNDYLSHPMPLVLQPPVALPAPKGNVTLQQVGKFAPNARPGSDARVILQGLTFALQPGDGLGVVGPSASGKSSLAKLLVGLWLPDQGQLRVDGATFQQWGRNNIGPHIGYLPQNFEFIPGTIAQNISRFEDEAKDEDIVAAAQLAGVHQMILSFPQGYATPVSRSESPLTGGQKQRIGLARALYKLPKLVVLDEPNSNLDVDGDEALSKAIAVLRANGSVVVVMAHRPSALAALDKVLMLKDGRMTDFGLKQEVIDRVAQAAQQAKAKSQSSGSPALGAAPFAPKVQVIR
jgi:ATP-binding cassette, subfamily C, bacterial exporter for protease/lipase